MAVFCWPCFVVVSEAVYLVWLVTTDESVVVYAVMSLVFVVVTLMVKKRPM